MGKIYDPEKVTEVSKKMYEVLHDICKSYNGKEGFGGNLMLVSLLGASMGILAGYGRQPLDLQDAVSKLSREATGYLIENKEQIKTEIHYVDKKSPIQEMMEFINKAIDEMPKG
ncbi:MAG: hypothetical protein ACE3JK_10490 [Sporolactobacillus sp.]